MHDGRRIAAVFALMLLGVPGGTWAQAPELTVGTNRFAADTTCNYNPEKLKRLKGISNWACHYLAAARSTAPTGEAFAEAMGNFQKTK